MDNYSRFLCYDWPIGMHLNINRRNALFASILFVLIAAVLALNQAGLFKNKQTNPPPPEYTKTDLPTDKLPEAFPKDLIQEKDPVILENYEARLFGGLQTQYTLKYITQKSVSENFGAYLKYFSKNQWAILNKDQKDNFATIRAAKNYDSITVTHSINQANGMQIVDLTLTHFQLEKSASTTNQSAN